MRYYCPNSRCADYAIIEDSGTRAAPVCPSCNHTTLPLDDDHLIGRVFFCAITGGMFGATFSVHGREVIGATAGFICGVFAALWFER